MTAVALTGRCPCGGAYEPDTDGMGNVIDVCGRCGAMPGKGKPLAPHLHRAIESRLMERMPQVGAPHVRSSNYGKKCTVEGCPGLIDATGLCACCEKRKQFAEQHRPKSLCPICGGLFVKKGRARTCKACVPLAKHLAESRPD